MSSSLLVISSALAAAVLRPSSALPGGRVVVRRPVSIRHSRVAMPALRSTRGGLFAPSAERRAVQLMCDAEPPADAAPVEVRDVEVRDFRDRQPEPAAELRGFSDAEVKFLRSITDSEPDWAAARSKMPSLASRSDDELRAAWVNSGTDISALWKTPVGPVLIINLILWYTGLSWCDTPLGVAEACGSNLGNLG